jgi:CheY-like chemotaxis protein
MSDKLRVLCVDDNREAAFSSGRLLEQAGCEVQVCHDGPSALAAAETFRPDVCVLDLKMPGMSGEELAQRLQEQAGERPLRCVALTGMWDINAQHRTNNAGFEHHLVKPAESERLVEAVLGRGAATSGVAVSGRS